MTHQYMEIKIEELEKRIEALEQGPKTGHWIKTRSENIWGWPVYECSECHTWLAENSLNDFKYCFQCGARMVESQESEVNDGKNEF